MTFAIMFHTNKKKHDDMETITIIAISFVIVVAIAVVITVILITSDDSSTTKSSDFNVLRQRPRFIENSILNIERALGETPDISPQSTKLQRVYEDPFDQRILMFLYDTEVEVFSSRRLNGENGGLQQGGEWVVIDGFLTEEMVTRITSLRSRYVGEYTVDPPENESQATTATFLPTLTVNTEMPPDLYSDRVPLTIYTTNTEYLGIAPIYRNTEGYGNGPVLADLLLPVLYTGVLVIWVQDTLNFDLGPGTQETNTLYKTFLIQQVESSSFAIKMYARTTPTNIVNMYTSELVPTDFFEFETTQLFSNSAGPTDIAQPATLRISITSADGPIRIVTRTGMVTTESLRHDHFRNMILAERETLVNAPMNNDEFARQTLQKALTTWKQTGVFSGPAFSERPTVVFIGDSITWGLSGIINTQVWQRLIQEEGIQLLNFGIPGAQPHHMSYYLRLFKEELHSTNPSVFVVMAGTNLVNSGNPTYQTGEFVSKSIEMLLHTIGYHFPHTPIAHLGMTRYGDVASKEPGKDPSAQLATFATFFNAIIEDANARVSEYLNDGFQMKKVRNYNSNLVFEQLLYNQVTNVDLSDNLHPRIVVNQFNVDGYQAWRSLPIPFWKSSLPLAPLPPQERNVVTFMSKNVITEIGTNVSTLPTRVETSALHIHTLNKYVRNSDNGIMTLVSRIEDATLFHVARLQLTDSIVENDTLQFSLIPVTDTNPSIINQGIDTDNTRFMTVSVGGFERDTSTPRADSSIRTDAIGGRLASTFELRLGSFQNTGSTNFMSYAYNFKFKLNDEIRYWSTVTIDNTTYVTTTTDETKKIFTAFVPKDFAIDTTHSST